MNILSNKKNSLKEMKTEESQKKEVRVIQPEEDFTSQSLLALMTEKRGHKLRSTAASRS